MVLTKPTMLRNSKTTYDTSSGMHEIGRLSDVKAAIGRLSRQGGIRFRFQGTQHGDRGDSGSEASQAGGLA